MKEWPPEKPVRPSGITVAVCPERAEVMVPASVHVSLYGSYISALLLMPADVVPPVTRTRPSGRRADACPLRASFMLAAAVKLPLPSYISAEASVPAALLPPVTSTLPSSSTVADASVLASAITPAVRQLPMETLGSDARNIMTDVRVTRMTAMIDAEIFRRRM